ncbi:MAG: T9SS type A sorting domain-containing protein [Sphingobacteriales bacterium]|nr:MAG: T9SS type A sorting domain-containing protein [Sphingobacteriales bacterium]
MKQLFTFIASLFITQAAIAQCTPAPVFSVTAAKLANQPLRVKADITTGSVSWPLVHQHLIYWGDGSNSYTSTSPSTTYHTYSSPGTYLVKYYLYKVDSSLTPGPGCYDSTSQSITVAYCNNTVKGFTDSSTGTSGQRKFTINGVMSGGSMVWDYGDSSGGTGAQVTHTYATGNPYTVTLYSIGSGCTDTFTRTVYPLGGGVGCSSKFANFTRTVNGLQVMFNNTSTSGGTQTHHWDFGDGNTSTAKHPTHTYAAAGWYVVKLINSWDSLCADTTSDSVTVNTTMNNFIRGYIIKDSTIAPLVPTYKVWLIVHDSAANTLTAVDSLNITGANWGWDDYMFTNVAPGKYLVKAALTNGPTSGTSYVPTYCTSSLSWSSATTINHTGGMSQWHNISMLTGTVTSGPGFVGGSISAGANKGTGSGMPGIDVYLKDATNGKVVKYATTDANGDYSFSSVPEGTYTIQPELLGYMSTSSVPFQISSTKTKVENMWFLVSNSKKTIKPVPASVMNVAEGVAFTIYPNPAKNKTAIQWNSNSTADAAIIVTDIAGKTVYNNTVKAQGETVIDLSQLNKGLYFINVSSANTQQTQKLVVE